VSDKERQRAVVAKYLRYYSVGLQFFIGIVLFTLGGVWLDSKCGTTVLFTLLGLALGFGGGLRAIYADLYGRSRRDRGEPSAGESPADHRTREPKNQREDRSEPGDPAEK